MNLTTSQIVAIVVGIIIIVFLLYIWLKPKTTVSTTSVRPANTNPIVPGPVAATVGAGAGAVAGAGLASAIQPPGTPIDARISSRPYVLYYFYMPKCVHCDNLKPIWDKVKDTAANITIKDNKSGIVYPLDTQEIDITKPENASTVSYYNVNAVPVIILKTPEKTVEYNGAREQTAIESFVSANL
jgi:thiol-disulfide isomerase/thioredoxin